jgi:hypothetical protein
VMIAFHGVVRIAFHGVVRIAFHGVVRIAFHGVVITVFCNTLRNSRSSSYVASMTKLFLPKSRLLNCKYK